MMSIINLKRKILSMFTAQTQKLAKPGDEPKFLMGFTLMQWTAEIGFPIKRTTDGQPIIPSEMYRIDDEGIFLV